ncbi:MAG TPA: PAS domain S-box protein, partial [Spirochaetes bacterium]|nr:PAS domain S-box protein [Spirochaetota bacterium]
MDRQAVLLVEDEYIIALDIRSTLEHIGYEVAAVASTGEEAVELSRKMRPGIVLMDIILGGEMDGVEAARLIRESMDVPVVYLTAYTDEATFNRARATEPYGYILKPVSSDTLYTTIETALQRHRLEIRLKHSEDLLNRTGEMARVGGWEIDLASDRVYWTGVTHRIHEVPDDYIPTVAEAVKFFAPLHVPVISEAVERARNEGVPYDLELEFITANGKNLWVRAMGVPEFRDGRCVRLFGTFQDITERKSAEDRLIQANEDLTRAHEEMEAANEELAASQHELIQAHGELKEKEERFRMLFNHSLDAIMLADDEARYVDVNPASCALTGYDREELLNMTVMGLTPSVLLETGKKMWDEFVAAGAMKGEYSLTRKDGSQIDVEFSATSHITPGLHLAILRDISSRKKSEKERLESEERLRNLIEHMPVLVDAFDADGVPLFWNRECESVTGYAAEEIVGNPRAFELLYPDEAYRN